MHKRKRKSLNLKQFYLLIPIECIPIGQKVNSTHHFTMLLKHFSYLKNYKISETKVIDGYNADEEVEKHLDAQIIILRTPLTWFGVPWIYKKYVD